ncbi:hypothetical protein [Citrobacter koseri]|uniref:hypothetical protein n=1 Tax=Citrobacter koseri TaxID=545 RepID=UPI003891B433
MKLEFRVGDHKLIEPDFKIYTHDIDKSLFMIAMKIEKSLENEIKSSINNNEFNIEINNGIMGLFISEYIYSFDIGFFLDDYLKKHVKNNFSVAFAFLDDNDKIKKEEIEVIGMTHK